MARIAPGVIPIKDQNPYETLRVLAEEDIEMDDVVHICGYTGDVALVRKACASSDELSTGRLFIARTAGAEKRALWIQPWRIVKGLDTQGSEVGAPVFLGEPGSFAFSIGEGMVTRRIGTVIDSGVISFDFDSSAPQLVAPSPFLFSVDVEEAGTHQIGPFTFDVEVVDAWAVKRKALGAASDYVQVFNGKGTISDKMEFNNKKEDDIVRSSRLTSGSRRVSAGGALRVKSFGKSVASTVHILARRV